MNNSKIMQLKMELNYLRDIVILKKERLLDYMQFI